MRDLLAVLGIDRVTVVGHSFGGGVAMQFAYQYPQLVERLVLVSAGGVEKDVSFALRLAAMPMGSEALAMVRVPGALPVMRLFGRAVRSPAGFHQVRSRRRRHRATCSRAFRIPVRCRHSRAPCGRWWTGAANTSPCWIEAILVESIPVQIIWGEEDLVIPVSHARTAHAAMPGSRLEIFEKSGHVPHHDHPDRFVEVVERFIDSTRPG